MQNLGPSKSSDDHFLLQILVCIFIVSFTLYVNVEKNNQLTELQLLLPQLEKEVKMLQRENERLSYEVDRFESPVHLMELLRTPEFSDLEYPHDKDVIVLSVPK